MDRDSTTSEIIKHLLKHQQINYENNVVHKLHEFIIKYCSNMVEDSLKYAQHAGRENIQENDVK